MFTRQKHHFSIVFELIQITDVLAINPYARGLRGFGGGNEAEFPHDLALREGGGVKKQNGKKKSETRQLESIRPNHVQSPYWLGDCELHDCRTNRRILQHPICMPISLGGTGHRCRQTPQISKKPHARPTLWCAQSKKARRYISHVSPGQERWS